MSPYFKPPWKGKKEFKRLMEKAKVRPSKAPPALITISPNEGEDFSGFKAKKVRDKYQVTFGSHATLGCWSNWLFGGDEACIALYYPPQDKRYTRIGIRSFETDIFTIINHETLHHVLMWLAADPLSQTYDQIDNIVGSVQAAKRMGL